MLIFKREFNRNLKALLIWTAILGGLILLILSIYPSFAKSQDAMKDFLKAYPEGFLKAFGMDKVNFGTILGFYAVEGYLMTTLFGSVYAVMLSSSILSKEHSEKTIEFLLSKPVSRVRIVSEKLLVVFVNLLLLNLAIALISLLGFQFSKDSNVEMNTFMLIAIAPLLLHLTFAAIGFLISTVIKRARNILSISLGLVFLFYFFSMVSGISDKYSNLKYMTPFKYVDAADIITSNEIRPLYIFIMLIVIIVCAAASEIIYNRKDIMN